MPTITPKFLAAATLTSTLTTTIYTAPASTITRIEHIIISNGSTAGTVTLSIFDGTTTTEILNAYPIAANKTLEIANIILNTGNTIRSGATTTTGAKITLFGTETV